MQMGGDNKGMLDSCTHKQVKEDLVQANSEGAAVDSATEASLRWNDSAAVLFSNRSAAHARLDQFHHALEDAEDAVRRRPGWTKVSHIYTQSGSMDIYLYIYICMYACMYVYVCMYVYIYGWRERARERERCIYIYIHIHTHTHIPPQWREYPRCVPVSSATFSLRMFSKKKVSSLLNALYKINIQ